MFWREVVKSVPSAGSGRWKNRRGRQSQDWFPPAFKHYQLCFRENGRHSFGRGVV